MEIKYKKNDNKLLFANLNSKDLTNIDNLQNYCPFYNNYFNLSENNYNSINLYNTFYLNNITEKISYNKYKAKLIDNCNNFINSEIFFKYSPLIDPIKYLVGKYNNIYKDISNVSDKIDFLYKLPKYQISNDENFCLDKINDKNNISYVDCFFSYLSSILLNNYNFINGLNFYGSFLGIKNDFLYNIEDDIDILSESDFFYNNKEILYKIDNNYHEIFNSNTRKNKNKINIENLDDTILLSDIEDLDNINDSNIKEDELEKDSILQEDNILKEENNIILDELNINIDVSNISRTNKLTNSRSSSTCSSRSSLTNSKDSIEEEDLSSEESELSDEEDEINLVINKFPIQLIALESCHDTLDSYIIDSKIKDKEWESIIMQILFILITYQKVFKFTHNDLHTNNIVYNNTDKKFIYYKFDGTYYKVPTFGKIYKIIDFGRSIYTFKNNLHISESFSPDGDAATQYNCEPYLNSNKPILNPNYSFDLCRLSCSLFDYFVEDLSDLKKIKSPIKKLIISWCYDDNNKNILYKSNGQERYPEFKLYKMIARIVNNHIPKDIIKNELFNEYKISKKKINSGTIVNIDEIPKMY
jgi:hypothetical protein